ncbi:MAG: acyl-CoA dehydrogenase family protein [Myxococcota bacterium]|nr:acyl-CoA dehydrogenase family protein [Myxococcota bacterium]
MSPSLLSPEDLKAGEDARAKFAALEPSPELADHPVLARRLADLGFFPYLIPAGFGGATTLVRVGTLCAIREQLAYFSPAADSIFAVHGLGTHPLVLGGSPEQRAEHLVPAAAGKTLWAFALTEPEAGSDVAALSTSATRDGDHYLLRGAKRFISNAGVASHYTLFARTSEGPKGISAFIVPAGTHGLQVRPMELMGDHPIGELELTDCRIPASALIGKEGDGMRLALGTLDTFRTTVGAAAVGMARRALDEAVAYARGRRQFGKPLSELAAVQNLIADSAVELEAAQLLVHRAAAVKDGGQARIPYEAGVAKLFATEAAQRIIDRCLQVHGGNGVVKGFAVERLYRDVRALRIYEGASEVQRMLIARHLLSS